MNAGARNRIDHGEQFSLIAFARRLPHGNFFDDPQD